MHFYNLILIIFILYYMEETLQNVAPSRELVDYQQLLRESIFDTISPPLLRNSNLYRQILRAPFHKGSLKSFSFNDTDYVTYQGDVFYIPNDRWIICQDDCQNCSECRDQKNPVIKWYLRHTKVSGYREDLAFSIVPQVDTNFHLKDQGSRSYVYVIPRKIKDVDKSTTEFQESVDPKSQSRGRKGSEDFGTSKTGTGTREDSGNVFHSHIILGTDNNGSKYVVQMARSHDMGKDGQESNSEKFYQKVLRGVVGSINDHTKYFEQFLKSDRKPNVEFERRLEVEDLKAGHEGDGVQRQKSGCPEKDEKDGAEKVMIRLREPDVGDKINREVVKSEDQVNRARIPRLNRNVGGRYGNGTNVGKVKDKGQANVSFGYFQT